MVAAFCLSPPLPLASSSLSQLPSPPKQRLVLVHLVSAGLHIRLHLQDLGTDESLVVVVCNPACLQVRLYLQTLGAD